jgi:hypothetical protein
MVMTAVVVVIVMFVPVIIFLTHRAGPNGNAFDIYLEDIRDADYPE